MKEVSGECQLSTTLWRASYSAIITALRQSFAAVHSTSSQFHLSMWTELMDVVTLLSIISPVENSPSSGYLYQWKIICLKCCGAEDVCLSLATENIPLKVNNLPAGNFCILTHICQYCPAGLIITTCESVSDTQLNRLRFIQTQLSFRKHAADDIYATAHQFILNRYFLKSHWAR